MQNIARDSENSSEDEFFDAHEGFSDSDEVFPKEMTKWNSNDFIDAFAPPMEAEGAPGKDPEFGCQHPTRGGDSENKSVLIQWGPGMNVGPKRVLVQCTDG